MLQASDFAHLGSLLTNVSTSTLCSIQTGGIAKYVFIPSSINSLIKGLKIIQMQELDYFVIGAGTNVLFSDSKYRGVVISLKELCECEVYDEKMVIHAGTPLDKVSYIALQHQLSGFEFATSMPGTIGGAILINGGSNGQTISDHLESVIVLDENGRVERICKNAMTFLQRSSSLKEQRVLLLLATFHLEKEDPNIIKERMLREIMERKQNYPIGRKTCGMIFIDSPFYKASELIQQVPPPKKQSEQVMVSEIHPNFIINLGHANAKEVKSLIDYIEQTVYYMSGIHLPFEVKFVNWR